MTTQEKQATKFEPKPGSEASVKAGCRCPAMDNHHCRGSGWTNRDSSPQSWISPNCPIHGAAK